VLFVSSAALAQSEIPQADQERARKMYEEANANYKLGKYEEAQKGFEEVYRVMKQPAFLFDIAQASRRAWETGKNVDLLRKSIDTYKAFLRDAPMARQRPVAEKLLPELEKQLAGEQRRRREELIAKASGANAVFLADQLVAEGYVREAALVLDRVLAARRNPHDVLVNALEKRALVAGALGDVKTATELFTRALSLDPGFPLPEGSEKATQQGFSAAQKALAGKKPLAITHVPPGAVTSGQAARITVTVESDPLSAVAELSVRYRLAGGGAYSDASAQKSTGAVEVPAAFLRGNSRVEYYVAALDVQEGELATLGTPKEPFVFTVAPNAAEISTVHPEVERKTPVYKKWWLWTVVVGVAAAGVGAGVGGWYATHPSLPKLPIPTN
jgi:tetratricopeptide (TPR) repeat protein